MSLCVVMACSACGIDAEPWFAFQHPRAGDMVSGVVEVDIGSRPPGRVAEVVLRIGDVEMARLTEEPFVGEVDLSGFSDGPITLTAEPVLAESGEESEPETPLDLSLIVDNEPPTVEVLPPFAAFREDGDEIPVRLMLDDGNGVTKVGVRAIAGDVEIGELLVEPDELTTILLSWDDLFAEPVENWTDVQVIASAVDAFGRETSVEQVFRLGTRKLWSANVAGLMLRPPVVASDGTIFVGSTKVSPDEGRVVRLDPSDGSELCQAPLGVETVYSLAEAGDLIVFGTSRAVRAIRTSDCGSAWTFGDPVSSPRSYWGTPAYDASAGRVYAVDANGVVYSINATNGNGSAFADTLEEVQSSPVVLADGGVMVGTIGGNMHGFDSAGSALPWSPYAAAGSIFGDPVVALDHVYFGSMDTYLYAFDPLAGSMLSGFGMQPDGFAIRSTPGVTPDGTVLVGTIGGDVHAVTPNGSESWSLTTGTISRGGVLVNVHASGEWSAYTAATDGSVYGVDEQGAVIWTGAAGAEIQTYGALGNDAFYVPADNFRLFAFDIRSPDEVDTP